MKYFAAKFIQIMMEIANRNSYYKKGNLHKMPGLSVYYNIIVLQDSGGTDYRSWG